MIDKDWAENFAIQWIEAFNSGDFTSVFTLYDDNFTMKSPFIIQRMNIESGTLSGKESIRPYWEKSLSAEPRLEFRLIDVFVGVDTVIIYYESIGRQYVCETFSFNNNGKIIQGVSQHGKPT